jgi:hypothetical protein
MKGINVKIHAKGSNGGYALVTALIFFLAATTAVIAAISDAVFREVRTVRNESFSKQTYFTAESALEDAVYRTKGGKNIDNTESLSIDSSTASVTIIESEDGVREIASTGLFGGTERTVKLLLEEGNGVSFVYAIQGGSGGIDLDGGASVTGDIYTTGSIRGCGGCVITGEAIAAGKSSVNIDADNSFPASPGQSIIFGNTNGTQDMAQSFTVSENLSLIKISLYIKKIGNPANATVRITTNTAGNPSNTVLGSGTLSSSLLSTEYEWIDITLTSNPILVPGTTYWIVIDGSFNSSNYYSLGANSSYALGDAKIGRYNNNWGNTSPGLDVYFKTYIGTNETGITGVSEFNKIFVGAAYAYSASYVSASSTLYCQIGTSNNKACDTSRADPAIEEYPIPDALISTWKEEAAMSVYSGNYTVGSAGATLGPKKINGNLTISDGGTLRVSGALWVTGNVLIEGSSEARPFDSTKSYPIIADGTIILTGGGEIFGNTDSHLLLLSTSSSDPAVSIQGGASDTVVFAPNGGLYVSGGASVRAGSAKHISVDGGARITYDPEFSNMNFFSNMPNSEFQIKSWRETE